MAKIDVETHYKVFDNETGSYFSVGPDDDGLGLYSISYFDSNTSGKADLVLTGSKDFLIGLGKALNKLESENGTN